MTNKILPTYARTDITFDHGDGCELVATNGDRYLDFGAGIAVNSLGHGHPLLVEAIQNQAAKLMHVSNLYKIDGQERLADRLCEHTFADKVFFANSGAEANECAVKMARRYQSAAGKPERYRVITFAGGFHGRTLAMIAAGGQAKHLEGFGPKVDGFDQVPLGDVEALKDLISDETAALMIEPIQGEGGIHSAEVDFLKELRALSDKYGLVLIFDEVQTGVGRTGALYSYQQYGVEPDILTTAKGLGGGFPVGACLAKDDVAHAMVAGTHGSTFGGNPLAMAAANAVLDIVLEPGFLENVREKGLLLKQKLASVIDQYPDVFDLVRGEGLLLGLHAKVSPQDVVAACFDEKLLCVPAGDNVVRILPPLIANAEEFDRAIASLERAAATLTKRIVEDQAPS
ncbi:MAG: aspartate aminotransferase family protein [Rhizobiales bacterium]|nr:aspartate aminotransferase family protein [Hyphomicrobiales bacterium]